MKEEMTSLSSYVYWRHDPSPQSLHSFKQTCVLGVMYGGRTFLTEVILPINHRLITSSNMRPIRAAKDFEAVDWATGFTNKHGCIVGLLKETSSVFL